MLTLFSGQAPEVVAAQMLFWLLLPCVLFAPPRWAILAWLVMGNLDTTGRNSVASTSVGWVNASKGILLPLYLWWRLRKVPGQILLALPARLWLLLALYAGVACFWSPFPLAAAKMVGNMVGILLTFVVLERAARCGYLSSRVLAILILVSLGLGVVQTVSFKAYGFDGVGRPTRFSSFVTAQQYAASLVAFFAVSVRHPAFRLPTRMFLVLALGTALVLNGSRTWFIGAVVIVLIYLWQLHARILAFSMVCLSTMVLGALLALNFNPNQSDPFEYGSSRITATAAALITGEDTAQRLGLANLNFRFSVYDGAISELGSSSIGELLLGHGTSSGGDVVMRVFPRAYRVDTLDPNRVLHNEWLRSLYEWGIGGLCLVIAVLATLLIGLMRRYQLDAARVGSAIALSFAPAFLLAFSTENLIAGAGNAVTMSLALLVSLSWAPPLSQPSRDSVLRIYARCSAH